MTIEAIGPTTHERCRPRPTVLPRPPRRHRSRPARASTHPNRRPGSTPPPPPCRSQPSCAGSAFPSRCSSLHWGRSRPDGGLRSAVHVGQCPPHTSLAARPNSRSTTQRTGSL